MPQLSQQDCERGRISASSPDIVLTVRMIELRESPVDEPEFPDHEWNMDTTLSVNKRCHASTVPAPVLVVNHDLQLCKLMRGTLRDA